MTIDQERLALFEEMREDELDAAALYRALAEASKGRRQDVLNRLAEAEERHARHWERLLRDAGITDFPPQRRTLRTRVLSALAGRWRRSRGRGRASRSPAPRAVTGRGPAVRCGRPSSGSTTASCPTSC